MKSAALLATMAAQQAPPPQGIFRALDGDRSRSLSAREWSLFFRAADFAKADTDRDGQVTPQEWRDYIRPRGAGRPGTAGPAVGQPVPALKLKALKDGRLVDLSQVERPTVLVFGSYT